MVSLRPCCWAPLVLLSSCAVSTGAATLPKPSFLSSPCVPLPDSAQASQRALQPTDLPWPQQSFEERWSAAAPQAAPDAALLTGPVHAALPASYAAPLQTAGSSSLSGSWSLRTSPLSTSSQLSAALPLEQESSELKPFTETWGLRLGGMYASAFVTEASLSSPGGRNAAIRFEDELSIDDNSSSFRGELYWRINRYHTLSLGYFDLDRRGEKTADRQFEWGDYTFDVGATIRSRMRTEILPLRYTYNLLAEDDYELGIGLGIYTMRLAVGLEGEARLNGSTFPTSADVEFHTPVPLPVFGVQGAYVLAPGLRAIGSLQVFYVVLEGIGSLDRAEGAVVDALFGLEYDLMNNLSIGSEVNWFLLNAGVERSGFELDLDYEFAGIYVYLLARI